VGTFIESLSSRKPHLLYFPQREFVFALPATFNATTRSTPAVTALITDSSTRDSGCIAMDSTGMIISPVCPPLPPPSPPVTVSDVVPLESCQSFVQTAEESIVIVVEQSVAGVGSTVWDAEVILAHYLHSLPPIQLGDYDAFCILIRLTLLMSVVLSQQLSMLSDHSHITLHTASENILELGAGTAIAAILCMKKGASVTVQELAEVMPHTLQCLEMNRTQAKKALACRWGEECVRLATDGPAALSIGATDSAGGSQEEGQAPTSSERVEGDGTLPVLAEHNVSTIAVKPFSKKSKKQCPKFESIKTLGGISLDSMRLDGAGRGQTRYDRVLMADVLYHVEDFTALINTVVLCIKPKGVLVLSFEQRRKNLDSFVETLASLFHSHETHTVNIEQAEEIEVEGGGGSLGKGSISVFHLHIFRSKISQI
jgi:predicted nicotinamide N-methyase